jgi:hypothetical protein
LRVGTVAAAEIGQIGITIPSFQNGTFNGISELDGNSPVRDFTI